VAAKQKILVKLGGTLLDDPASRKRISVEIAALVEQYAMTVVHGGGKQMTRFLAERGVESQFVDGLRVTTPEVVDALLKVFAGSVNHELVASLVAAGANPVGLTGIDAALVEAEQLKPELGAVGKPVRTNPAVLDTLVDGGFVPVVACVAGDRKGNVYNVNADQMAVACASGFRAERLIFMTDVDGVLDAEKRLLPKLTREDCARLIADGVATGGMQAKLNSATDALNAGIAEVVIAPGARPGLLADLLSGAAIGTKLVR
jgi:acetylglutamate kinase